VGYLRVSTGKQAQSGLGIEAQRARIQEECSRRGWDVSFVSDEGVSASSASRPGLESALGMLERGEAGILVAAKLDRLSRSVAEACRIGETARRKGWDLVVLDASGIDTTTPHGKAQLGMMAVFAELERDMAAVRTAEALQVKRRQGDPRFIPEELEKRIVGLYKSQMSMGGIAELLNREGVPTARGGRWAPQTVWRVVERAR
jgi:DNA invertase Pin-like site-specific DNA recombinase